MARMIFDKNKMKVLIGIVLILLVFYFASYLSSQSMGYDGELETEHDSDEYDDSDYSEDDEVVVFEVDWVEYGDVWHIDWTIDRAEITFPAIFDFDFWGDDDDVRTYRYTLWDSYDVWETEWDLTFELPDITLEINFGAITTPLGNTYDEIDRAHTALDGAPMVVGSIITILTLVFIATMVSMWDISI